MDAGGLADLGCYFFMEEALANPRVSPLQMAMFDAIEELLGLPNPESQAEPNEELDAGKTLLQDGHVTLTIEAGHVDYLEFLEKEGPSLLEVDLENKKQKKIIILKLAQNMKILPPPNPSILGSDFDIKSQWRYILNELIKEMRIVHSRCSLELRNSGVYVLTSTPYNAVLEMLAEEYLSG